MNHNTLFYPTEGEHLRARQNAWYLYDELFTIIENYDRRKSYYGATICGLAFEGISYDRQMLNSMVTRALDALGKALLVIPCYVCSLERVIQLQVELLEAGSVLSAELNNIVKLGEDVTRARNERSYARITAENKRNNSFVIPFVIIGVLTFVLCIVDGLKG